MPRLLVVVASTRPGRAGRAVADWFVAEAQQHGGFEIEVADLAELDLPMHGRADAPACCASTSTSTPSSGARSSTARTPSCS